MSKWIIETDDRGVAVLKINNPPLNAADEEVLLELEEHIKKIEVNAAVKVVILSGEGGVFMAGADINRVREVKTREDGIKATSVAQGILNRIWKSRKPYIAVINGLALGGGTELALACHMRFAGDQAQMGLPEIRLGILPGFGGTQRMARLLGPARALEYMLTGKFIAMPEAERVGLVNRVFPQNELMDEAKKFARSIAFQGQVAVRSIMEAVMDGVNKPLSEGLELESRLFGELCETEDKEEGLSAFLEKRKPSFKDK